MRGHHRGHFRRGMRHGRHLLHPALLLMMLQGPAHGYDLAERLATFGFRGMDPSLIYRALRRLEEDGLATSDWDKEKTQGPPRRVYTLSEEGHDALKMYVDDLQATRDRIEHLLETYRQYSPDDGG